MKRNSNSVATGRKIQLFHRWFSFLLMLLLFFIGIYIIAKSSILSAVLYLIVGFFCLLIILYFYCSKCPCRDTDCAHFLFGPIANMVFSRKQGPYSKTDLLLTGIGFSGIALFPQYWLLSRPAWLIVYWGAAAITYWEISRHVCAICGNIICPANKKSMQT